MPQSLSSITVHIIFSTKDRVPFLDASLRDELSAYLSTVIRNSGSIAHRIGGTEDHVHLAISVGRTITISQLVEQIKVTTSRWIKTKDPSLSTFSWQRGYAALSLRTSELPGLVLYIDGQMEHHRKHSFMDEYLALLDECGVEYDRRYMFD